MKDSFRELLFVCGFERSCVRARYNRTAARRPQTCNQLGDAVYCTPARFAFLKADLEILLMLGAYSQLDEPHVFTTKYYIFLLLALLHALCP